MRDHFLPGTANFEKLFEDVITETSGQSGDCGQFLLAVGTRHAPPPRVSACVDTGPNIATLSPVTQVQYNTAAGTELAPFIPHNAILSRLRARATERNACHDLAW